jgi:hypothetical protein
LLTIKRKRFSRSDFVILLEASDAFLRQRVMNLPEKAVIGTHNTELGFQRRLKTYNDLGEDGQAEKFFENVDRSVEIFSKLFDSHFY